MFPDPTLRWHPYPSIIDGIKRPPHVFDGGLSRGKLILIVLECPPGTKTYGIEIDCEAYSAFDEMIYSIADHGDASGRYDGRVYIKEAINSRMIEVYTKIDPFERKVRHFLFVGNDYCYETLGVEEPVIHTFASEDEAFAWVRDQHT